MVSNLLRHLVYIARVSSTTPIPHGLDYFSWHSTRHGPNSPAPSKTGWYNLTGPSSGQRAQTPVEVGSPNWKGLWLGTWWPYRPEHGYYRPNGTQWVVKRHFCFRMTIVFFFYCCSADSNIQQAANQLLLYLPPSTQQKEQILWLHVFRSVFRLPWTLWQSAWQNTPYGWL